MGVLVIIMTCHVCRGAAAATTTVTTTGDRSGNPEPGTEPQTGGRDLGGISLTPGPAGRGVRALRESRLRKEIKRIPLGQRRGRAVTERDVLKGGMRGDLTLSGGRATEPTGRGGQVTEPTGRGETRGRGRRGGDGTR